MADEISKGAAKAALDFSLTAGVSGGFSISLKIDNSWLAGAVCLGALSLGAFYLAYKWPSEKAIRRALEQNNLGDVDPSVTRITDGHSILVELFCRTQQSFLLFVEDFESNAVKFRLKEEFRKIGFKDDLEVIIRNREEVYKKVERLRDNFFCLTCLLFNIGSKTLRSYFKNTWPIVNGTRAAWSDVPVDGVLLLGLNKGLKLANHEKAAVQAGDTNKWDLSLVLKVLMHSEFTHGPRFVSPHSQEYFWLDDIREIRNTLIGHAKDTVLPNAEFLAAWQLASGILENFGASKEEITAVRDDIEGTRKDAQEYRQRLLEAEEREKKVVEHLKTVDERLVNIEKNQSDIYKEIQKRQEEKVHKEANDAANRGLRNVIHINVTAETGSQIAISDIASVLGQGKTDTSTTASAVTGKKARALFPFQAREEFEEELTVEAGDIVDVLDVPTDHNWWMCRLGDNKGTVPSNRLKIIEEGEMAQSKDKLQKRQGRKARALYAFQAQNEDELTIEAGDVVDVLDNSFNWWLCRLGDNKGLVSSNYLQMFEERGMAQAKDKPQERQGKSQSDGVVDEVCGEELYAEPYASNYQDDYSGDDYESGTQYAYEAITQYKVEDKMQEGNKEEEEAGYVQLFASYKKSIMSGEWKAKPLGVVISSKVEGISEEEWSADKLFSDPDDYLQRMASSGGETKSKVEQKILQEILPSLESRCRQTDHHSVEVFQILAKLGCCQHSQSTVKHSLYLLRHFLTKNKVGRNNARTIVKIEKILRGSFSSKDSLFNLESIAAQRLRLTVYSKVLCLLAISRCKGFVTFKSIDLEEREDAKVLLENLEKCFSDTCYKNKDELQHMAELTLTSLKWIFTEKQPIDQLSKALQCFKELLSKSDSPLKQEVSHLVKKLCGYGWFCVQVTLCCIEHEIQSEPDPNALDVLFSIMERETSKKAPDWKFFTAISGILSNATMTNRDKDVRMEAGRKLGENLLATKTKKSPEVMEAIERKLSRTLFSPDPEVRISSATVLSTIRESISAEHIINYLCWFHRNQALERKKIIRNKKNEVVYLGSFQGQRVAIKTMRPSMHHNASHELDEMESIKSAFTKESYFLACLNHIAKHPNIIHLLCCNTLHIPYHLITEYFIRGNLLKYLRQDCRSETPLRELANLSQWCLEILEALIFLSKYKIVHKKIMARSVFVGEDEVCKLSGFSAAEQAVKQESGVIMCSSGKVQLDSPGNVCWLAPEVLRDGCYSSASDVWAFGVLMYEVFSLGCTPCLLSLVERPNDDYRQFLNLIFSGKHLPKLSCFDVKIYELMERCWTIRPSVEHLKDDMSKLLFELKIREARWPAMPPQLLPEVQPPNEEDALRRTKVLTEFLQSKQEEAFIGNLVTTAATTSSKSISLSGREEEKDDIDTPLTASKPDTLRRRDAPVKPPGEVGASRRSKAPRVFRELKPKKEASSGSLVTIAAATSSFSTSGGGDASTDTLVPDGATRTSSEPSHCVTTNQDEDGSEVRRSDSPIWV